MTVGGVYQPPPDFTKTEGLLGKTTLKAYGHQSKMGTDFVDVEIVKRDLWGKELPKEIFRFKGTVEDFKGKTISQIKALANSREERTSSIGQRRLSGESTAPQPESRPNQPGFIQKLFSKTPQAEIEARNNPAKQRFAEVSANVREKLTPSSQLIGKLDELVKKGELLKSKGGDFAQELRSITIKIQALGEAEEVSKTKEKEHPIGIEEQFKLVKSGKIKLSPEDTASLKKQVISLGKQKIDENIGLLGLYKRKIRKDEDPKADALIEDMKNLKEEGLLSKKKIEPIDENASMGQIDKWLQTISKATARIEKDFPYN